MKTMYCFILTMIITGQIYGQSAKRYEVIRKDIDGSEKKVGTIVFKDSLQFNKAINDYLLDAYEEGFLSAETLVENEQVILDLGLPYQLKQLNPGNLDPALLNKVGFRQKLFRNRPFRHNEVKNLMDEIVSFAENNGYPFVLVRLDSITVINENISANIHYDPGPAIVFDSISIEGDLKLKRRWLESYLDLHPGQPFNAKTINEIEGKIEMLGFATLNETPEVVFTKNNGKVYLNISHKKVNSVDGILGFLPNQKKGNKLLVTGRLDLDLYNLFNSGKELHVFWEKINVNSQNLDLSYYHPNLFRMPLGFGADFFFLKQDTTFFNRNFNFFFDFIPRSNQKLSVNAEFFRSRVSGIDTSSEGNLLNDVDVNYYGLVHSIFKLDNRVLPTSGWQSSITLMVGDKKIIKNPGLDDTFYEGINLNSIQYKVLLDIDKYFALKKSVVLRTHIVSGILKSQKLYKNDLFRLGGINSIRGFNEQFFYVSQYVYVNLELRLLAADGTYLFAFIDPAWINDESISPSISDTPFGTGLGISFSTSSGIFNFVFAFGQSQNQELSFDQAKIHFGYTGRF